MSNPRRPPARRPAKPRATAKRQPAPRHDRHPDGGKAHREKATRQKPAQRAEATRPKEKTRVVAHATRAPVAHMAGATKWYKMLASWYGGSGGGSCGNLQDGHLHYAELGVAGDYGHGVGRGRGNMAIDLGLPAALPCGAGGWIRYKGRTTYATKADVGYGNTSLPPNARTQRRIDLYVNLARYLHFSGVDYIEFAPNFRTHTGGTAAAPLRREWVNPLEHAKVRPERIDQGVDYAGTGYLVAVTHATVTKVVPAPASGWPGYFIEYQITTPGQLRGAYVYYAEGVRPNVRVGQILAPGEKVATLIPGWYSGIELGFGSGAGTTSYYGYHDGAYRDGTATRPGLAWDVLVRRLGGPGGIVEGAVVGKYPEYFQGGQLSGEITQQTYQGITPGNALGPTMQHETASGLDWGVYVKRNWHNLDKGCDSGAGYAGAARKFALGHTFLPKAK